MGRWVVSVLGLEPLHLKGNSHLAGARAAGMTRRSWAAARSADAARPALRGVNALVTTAVDLTPRAAPKHRGPPVGAETASRPLTCNVPSMAARRREACWRLITGRLSVPPPISQRQAGTTATLTWSRHCRSERMTQFWHPTGVQGPAGQVFRQRRLGRERRARGDSGSPAPRRVAGPGFWQVQRPAGERRPGPGNIGQVDRDLRVLHRQTQARALP